MYVCMCVCIYIYIYIHTYIYIYIYICTQSTLCIMYNPKVALVIASAPTCAGLGSTPLGTLGLPLRPIPKDYLLYNDVP